MTRKQTFDYSDLTPVERLELAQKLGDSVPDAEVELPLTKAQRDELDRRLEEYERDPEAGETWASVRDEILRDLAEDRASAA